MSRWNRKVLGRLISGLFDIVALGICPGCNEMLGEKTLRLCHTCEHGRITSRRLVLKSFWFYAWELEQPHIRGFIRRRG